MIFRLRLLLLGLLTGGMLCAQPAATISKPGFERFTAIAQEYVDNHWIAGATMVVWQNGNPVYQAAVGFADLRSKTKLRTDHIFRIASQTKAITTTAVMILFDEGKILLDDPISRYIPAFAKSGVLEKFNERDTTFTIKPLTRAITIRDLLTHTSGVGYAQIGSEATTAIAKKMGIYAGIGVPSLSLKDQVDKMAALPLEHQPGEKFTYGLNIDILGRLVEIVSGLPLDQFFRQRIFDPLGMNDTWFYLPADKQGRLVALNGEDSTGKVIPLDPNAKFGSEIFDLDYPKAKGKLFAGGAGLVSTANDYAIFMQMILNGGIYKGKRILSNNAVQLMTHNQIGALNEGNNKFGLGFEITTEQGAARLGMSPGSLSWGGAFSSSYWIDPQRKIVAQLFINQFSNSHGEIHDKFKVQVNAAISSGGY
ncbi:serine hydrolase domain-containing protein [Flavihumibacter petaseus]|uniref:Beta-lactamase-related domain-containing protein n=1 Tax=Flavihumibacter petaseus NBRC 106054 TaxID=1220578 RepID=A0A0E9MWD9_9BACT|nr:serine hydrolase domain-containing protein [Flavihumibacter petaseus]GAO41833.1 hypothetical protein FPE01S_01_08480 [Flavihumibacter petaseus NBRC 106054]